MGSTVTLLHSSGWLGWLDAALLKVVVTPGPWFSTREPDKGPDAPVILLIGSQLYEGVFGQVSPLHPADVARLLDAIPLDSDPDKRGRNPTIVVIDLDMSPGPAPASSARVEEAIGRIRKAGVPVVVPTPIRASTPELQRVKADWLRRICATSPAAGGGHAPLLLALPEVETQQGAVLQVTQGRPNLANVAAEFLGSGSTALSLCIFALDSNADRGRMLVSTLFRSQDIVVDRRHPIRKPFNARFFMSDDVNVHVATSLDAMPFGAEEIAGRPLFVGSSFNPADRFVTPFHGPAETVEGVTVHAASFYALRSPVTESHLIGFVLDVALGLLVATLFHRTWGKHAAVSRWARANGRTRLLPRVTLLANFALAGVLVVVLVLLSRALLLPANIWVSPGPIVIGVFVKFALVGSAVPEGHSSGTRQAGPDPIARVDWGGAILLAVAAVYVVVAHSH